MSLGPADLDARIRRMEDTHAIQQLVGRYSLAVDDHDFGALNAVFSVDATYGWHGREPDACGRDAVVELLRSRIAPAGPSFHVNHDHLIDWDEGATDRASGIVFAHAEGSPGGRQLLNAIRYYDTYVRESDGWRIRDRRLAFLYITPPEDYASVLLARNRLRHIEPAQAAHWPQFEG